jgi:tetratricopeptide (TPR) repeat protein
MKATEKRKTASASRKSRAAAQPKPRPRTTLTAEQQKAYKEYEHAVSLVYKQEYARAAEELKGLVERHPHDRDLLDRTRIYLRVCEARTRRPQRGETPEPYLQALVLYNEGEYDEALKILDREVGSNQRDARLTYLTACAHLAHGERQEGLRLLRESIRLDVTNRYRALNDPDLEEIRTAEDFVDALGEENAG